jgi:hypothetical protein
MSATFAKLIAVCRIRQYLPACLVLFTVLVAAQARCGTQLGNVAPPGQSHLTGSTYSNEFLSLTYQVPDGFSVKELPDNLPAGSFPLLMADQPAEGPFKSRLLLVADDTRRYGSSLTAREYVSKVVRVKLVLPRMEVLRDAYLVEISGAHFYRADYKQQGGEGALFKTFVCTKRKGFFVSWTFASSSQQELKHLNDSLQTISWKK